MGRNLGEGISEFGNIISNFGLELLKKGVDESTRVKAENSLLELSNHLDSLSFTPEQKKDAIYQAASNITESLPELNNPLTQPSTEQILNLPSAQMAGGDTTQYPGITKAETPLLSPLNPMATPTPAMATSAVGVNAPITPTPTPATPEPSTLQGVYAPSKSKYDEAQKYFGSQDWKDRVQAVIKNGGKATDIAKLKEMKLASLVAEGTTAVELSAKQQTLDIQSEDAKRRKEASDAKIANDRILTELKQKTQQEDNAVKNLRLVLESEHWRNMDATAKQKYYKDNIDAFTKMNNSLTYSDDKANAIISQAAFLGDKYTDPIQKEKALAIKDANAALRPSVHEAMAFYAKQAKSGKSNKGESSGTGSTLSTSGGKAETPTTRLAKITALERAGVDPAEIAKVKNDNTALDNLYRLKIDQIGMSDDDLINLLQKRNKQ